MPPKKPKAKAAPQSPNASELTVDLKALENVTDVLAEAKRLRHFYQLERDKVYKLWEITQKEVENNKNELLNFDQEMEEMENKHQVEIKVYKQKVRHLLYEHRLQVQSIRAQCDKDLTQAIELHHQRIAELTSAKSDIHGEMDKAITQHGEEMLHQRDDHQHMLCVIKHSNFKHAIEDMEERYKTKLEVLREELDLRRRAEIHEVEERKNEHINSLIKLHEDKFKEMKDYYNQITANNLDLIKSLKEEISNMKRNDKHNESLMYDIEKENQQLIKPLEEVKKEVAELQVQLGLYEKAKQSLQFTRSRLRAVGTEYEQLCADHNELLKRYQEVFEDRERLRDKFEEALREAMETTSCVNINMQQRLSEIHADLEKKEVQMANILRAVNIEPSAQRVLTQQIEETLEEKNRAIKDLHFELKKIEKTHKDVVIEYERRCVAAKIPVLDLDQIS